MFVVINGALVELSEGQAAAFEAARTVTPPDPRLTMSLPRADFAMNAAEMIPNVVTEIEAEEWATQRSLPSIATRYIDTLPEAERFPERIALLTRASVNRLHPAIVAIGAAVGMTDAQIDLLFTPRT